MGYARMVTLDERFEEAVTKVKEAFKDQGFGALTEIDVQATLREKLGTEMEPYLIIGACNPQLAHRAIGAVPAVGVFLPCNVVVRADAGRTVVEAMDPDIMAKVIADPVLESIAAEASGRVQAALDSLTSKSSTSLPPDHE
ncbi:DUF302 domain-containing protein [Acidiferrimicrobium sp. IK]|uniref:DUF302 domain-containing protein n=1 Tax=Acidiferrimicrobium sp. IK TaxID=2871700 RepID=UPI0021CB2D56|nr:DUF302 domain-containing protein [Acidiferrimicrobium sp. IK]MCU4185230.1 DUF302 domain-containing protein [Acidiferrimicrobium sp. IK]